VEAGELPVASRATTVGAPTDEPVQKQAGWLRRHWRAVTAAAAVAGVLLVGAMGFLWWLSSQWFVGPNGEYVAIYQGIPQQMAGVPLNRVVTRTALPVASLPYYDQAQLGGTLDAATETEALRIVTDLEAKSASCTSGQAPLGCPVVGPGTGSGSGSGTTLPSASPSPTASPGTLG
jgi:protein phosphatase